MGDGLAFARVFCSISGAEEVPRDGDEGFIVVAVGRMDRSVIYWEVGVRLAYLLVHPPEWEYTTGIAFGSAMET